MRKFYVLCATTKNAQIKTAVPVLARDNKHAVQIARTIGLTPYCVTAGK